MERDRVRVDIPCDLAAMQAEVAALTQRQFVHYDVLPLTRPRPRGGVVTDYADGTWADWPATDLLAACPAVRALVDDLRQRTRVTSVRVLRLAPGSRVEVHTDPTLGLEVDRSLIRLTVPILTNDEAVFLLDEAPVRWQPGECWYLDFTKPHSAWNGGDSERIHLTIDVEPNGEIRRLISDGATAFAS